MKVSSNKQITCLQCMKVTIPKSYCDACSIPYCSLQCKINNKWKHQCSGKNKYNNYQTNKDKDKQKIVYMDKNQQLNTNKINTGSQNDIKIKNGQVGLVNLDNTCYMNSCLQCLSHTQILTQYFLNKYYIQEINKENPLGSEGKFVSAYAQCIQKLWNGPQLKYKPKNFKLAIGKINQNFDNNRQHDAHQFYNQVIDGLHQDLNRVKQKEHKNYPNNMQDPDEEASKKTWIYHISRNQSIITDIMTGLFKSTLYCKKCQRNSVTFQPFNIVNLPIPDLTKINKVTLLSFPHNYNSAATKKIVEYDSYQHTKFIQNIIKQQQRKFMMYFSSTNRAIYNAQKMVDLQNFHKLIKQKQYKVFQIEYSSHEQLQQNLFPLTTIFTQQPKPQQPLSYKRPFLINFNKQTGLSLHIKILKHLYNKFYKQKQKSTFMGVSGMCYQSYQKKMLKEKPFQLIISNTFIREGIKRYNSDKRVVVKDQTLICNILYDLLKNLKEPNSPFNGQNFAKKEEKQKKQYIQNNFQLIVEFKKTSQSQQFDIKKMYNQIQELTSVDAHDNHQNICKQISLQKCFEAFKKQQILNSKNLWYCPWCEQDVQAKKVLSIYNTPEILTLLINRFSVKSDMTRQKNQTPIKFPFQLDLQKYVDEKVSMAQIIDYARKKLLYFNSKMQIKTSSQKYQLYAYIIHSGTLKGGHYQAYAKSPNGKWNLYNDEKVTPVQPKEMQWKNAYMLFYKRKKI